MMSLIKHIDSVSAEKPNVPPAPLRPRESPTVSSEHASAMVEKLEEASVAQREAIEAAVREANIALASSSVSFHFAVDNETNQVIVRVMDQQSGKVIRQVPSEEQLAISTRLRELVGVIFSHQA
jgi:flagellar protein FlaG